MEHPRQLGKYPITAVIGEGAMGVVYRAHDPGIGRDVAIKTVHAKLLESDEDNPADAADGMAARFRNEARAVGRLSHPGIVAIYEYGEDAGTAFIAMEYVEGKTLAQLLGGGPPLPETEILHVMDQLLEALACAHRHGVWHRDIKPANLIVTASGQIKITDFGIARIENAGLTQASSQIGTPGYMAPEQYSGEVIDHRADLYASGVLLYRLLTGRKPFEGSASAVMFKVMNHDPVPPSQVEDGNRVDGYDAIIARALARSAADRFADAAEFRRALAERRERTLAVGSSSTDLPTLLHRIPAAGKAASTAAGSAWRPGAAPPATAPGSAAAAQIDAPTSHATALAPTGWSTDLLTPVEKSLASIVGPMARIMVKQAARQSADLAGLIDTLQRQIETPADRDRFLARLDSSGATRLTSLATTAPSGADTRSTGASPAQPLSEEIRSHATRVLTTHVGPIARILVKKAATATGDRDRFYEALADLAEGVDRARLLSELRGAG